jgi:hypothetical protein
MFVRNAENISSAPLFLFQTRRKTPIFASASEILNQRFFGGWPKNGLPEKIEKRGALIWAKSAILKISRNVGDCRLIQNINTGLTYCSFIRYFVTEKINLRVFFGL